MKSLKHPGQTIVLLAILSLLSWGEASSQCSVNAGPDKAKCFLQPYNPGPFVSVSGTTGAVTYSWNGTTFNPTPNTSLTPAVTTTYTLTILDANGCTATDQFTLTVQPLPTVSAGPDISICSGVPTQICATASSVNGAITLYTWNGGPPSQCWTISPTIQTTYSVTAVDAAGCQNNDSRTVLIYPLPTVSAGLDQSICLSQGSIQLTGTPAGGTWSGTGVSATGLFTASTAGNTTLTYSFVNVNNCSNSDQTVVTVTSPATIDGGMDQDLCLNDSNLQLPSVGTWTGSPNVSPSGLFTPSAVGSYNLTVTSGTPGCTVTDNVQIEVYGLPVVNAGSDASICTAQTTVLNGSASIPIGSIVSTVWTGSGLSNAAILNPTASPTILTNYILTATSNEGCVAADQVTVTVNTYPTVNAGNDVTICSNSGTYLLTGFLPVGGTWSGSGVSSAGLFTPTLTGGFILTYSYTNASGCNSTDQMTMTVAPPGTVDAGADFNVCLNTAPVQLNTGGSWTGSTWVNPTGLFTPGATGTYVLTYTASTGLCFAGDQIQIVVKALPVVNAGVDQSICIGETAQFTASATSVNGIITSYTWPTGAVSNSAISNPTTTPIISTTYTVAATDVLGCVSNDAVTVTVNSLPIVNAGNDLTTCINGGAVGLAGNTPAGGTWSGTDVLPNGVFNPTALGSFVMTYSYTNSNGCEDSDQMTITVILAGPLDAGSDQTVCMNSPAIQLTSGGTWSGSPLVTAGGLFTPSAAGDYNLVYSAMSGGCMTTDQLIIHVLPLPIVNVGSDISTCAGTTVSLNGTATSANGAITTYYWPSNAVSNQNINNPTLNTGIDVTLIMQATDVAGCLGSDQLNVIANPNPIVSAGSDITYCDQGIAQQLTGFSPNGGVWSGQFVNATGLFTPNTTGTFDLMYCYTNGFSCTTCDMITVTVIPTVYANAGSDIDLCTNSSPVSLTPITSGGTWTTNAFLTASGSFTPSVPNSYSLIYSLGSSSCQTSDQVTVVVNALPTVTAGADASVCESNSFQLTGGGSGFGSLVYEWNHPELLDNPNIAAANATVSNSTNFELSITDGNGCSATDDMTLAVVAMPVAAFTMSANGCINSVIPFTNSSVNSSNYQWSFGNSNNSTDVDPTTIYLIEGDYNINLTAYNSLGCTDTEQQSIHILKAPVAQFSMSETEGCSPISIAFSNETDDESFTSTWDLDGSVYIGMTPLSTVFQATTDITEYNIVLTATNMCGTDDYTSTVTVHPQPHAAFTTDLSSLCSPVTTVFNNSSVGNPQTFFWELGDGDTSSDMEPAPKVYVTEETSENFTIKLFAYNSCGSDSSLAIVTVLPNTVEINLQPSVGVGCSPLFVEFNNLTTGATNFEFDFDDSSFSNLMSPNHIFEEAGTYNIIYYANDGCSYDTTTVSIVVMQSPEIDIFIDEQNVCPMEEVHMHSNTVGAISGINWDFGDGQFSDETDPTHEYAIGNNYFISATATEINGCPATASLSFEVFPQPDASMSLSADDGCSPLTVCTTNETNGATLYSWNFGNGFTSSALNECQEYINTSSDEVSYMISLDAENSFGCTDHIEQSIVVQPQPVTTFTLSDDASCFSMESVNVNVTTIGSTSYEWYVDGVQTSTASTPVFQFEEIGTHEVYVISFNDLGCSDVSEATYTIHPTPVIDIMPNEFNGCAPLTVSFDNQTTDGTTWVWSFGNGAQSTAQDPEIVFVNPGMFSVQLIATSEFGCEQVQFYDDMIEVYEVPVASFGISPDDMVIYDLDVAFADSSIGATDYYWDFGDGFHSIETSPIHHYGNGGYYVAELMVKNDFGCTSEISKPVNIDNTFNLFMPNAFTPGDDNINDVFKPTFSSDKEIAKYEFAILNRWGEIIFETTDTNEGWMGNARNGEYYTHNDLFTWTVKISFNNNQVNRSYNGNVTVLR